MNDDKFSASKHVNMEEWSDIWYIGMSKFILAMRRSRLISNGFAGGAR